MMGHVQLTITKLVRLSPRQVEVIHLIKENPAANDHELANLMGIQTHTFKSHIRRIYDRLGVRTRLECILLCQELDIL